MRLHVVVLAVACKASAFRFWFVRETARGPRRRRLGVHNRPDGSVEVEADGDVMRPRSHSLRAAIMRTGTGRRDGVCA